MTLLNPWGLWLLLLAPLLLALYLRRSRRQAVTVSALLLWQRVVEQSARHRFLGRLRHPLSLLVFLLLLLALALAVSRPEQERFMREASVVVVLDAGVRMGAIEPGGGNRFQEACRLASAYLGRASDRRPTALLVAGREPEIALPFTTDPRNALLTLGAVQQTDAVTDLSGALELAESLLESRSGHRELVVLTDQPAPADSPDRRWYSLGSSLPNAGLSLLALRPLPGSPQTWEGIVRVHNFSETTRQDEVQVQVDGQLREVMNFLVPPGEGRTQSFRIDQLADASGAVLVAAQLMGEDALASDNRAFALVPPPEPLRVLLISQGNRFLESYLRSDTTVRFELLDPSLWRDGMAKDFDVVLFDQWVPAGFSAENPPPGNYWFFGRSPFELGEQVIERPLLTTVATDHPILRGLLMEPLVIFQARPLVDRGKVLLASGEEPLMIAEERQGFRLLAVSFAPAESDFPLRTSFPLFASAALHWLAGKEEPLPVALSAGMAVPLPEKASIVAPDGATRSDQGALFVRTNGFYRITTPDFEHWVAVNTGEPKGVDLRRIPSGVNSAPPTIAGGLLSSWPLWRWIALLAFGVLLIEWGLFHRRITE